MSVNDEKTPGALGAEPRDARAQGVAARGEGDLRGDGEAPRGGEGDAEAMAAQAAEAEREAQERLAELARAHTNAVVRAGAGTGKTYSLVACVVHMLAGLNRDEAPMAPGRLCAITFTEKAAAEMQGRIREVVHGLTEAPEGYEPLRVSAAHMSRPLPDAAHWRRIERDLGAMVVSTFHGFCAQILREHPVAAGVEPGFGLADELTAEALLSETVENVVFERLARGDGACLRALKAIPVRQGSYGASLTKLLGRIVRRVREDGLRIETLVGRHGVTEGQPLEVHHQRCLQELDHQRRLLVKLHELIDPMQLASGSAADQVLLRDLNQFAPEADALKAQVEALPLEALVDHLPLLARYAQPVRRRARQARALSGRVKHRIFALPTFQENYLARMLHHAAEGLRADVLDLLLEVERRYTGRKREAGLLDFTDLVVLARDVLRDHPEVRRSLKRRFNLLLVDEFQDTNQVQLDLVMMLGERLNDEAALAPGDDTLEAVTLGPGRLFMVGDPKQSIYNFRGADVAVFQRVEGRLVDDMGVARRWPLQRNRRSLGGLIEFGNAWFEDVLGAHSGGDADYVVRFRDDDRLEAVRQEPGPQAPVEYLALSTTATPGEEARAVAAWIRAYMQGKGPAVVYERSGGQARARSYGDVAILLRRFRNLSAYQDALQRLQIPYYVVKGRGFYGCPEIRDLHQALALLLDPDDGVALVAVLRSPLFLLSDEGLVWLQRAACGRSRRALTLEAVMRLAGEPPEEMRGDDQGALRGFAQVFGRLRAEAGRLGPSEVLAALLELTSYREKLAGTFRGRQRIGNVDKLLELAQEYERVTHGHLQGFVRRLQELIEQEPREPEGQVVEENAEVVRIMTIHQSKGLEFPVVMIPEVHAMTARHASGEPVQYDLEHGLQVRLRARHMGKLAAELTTEHFEPLRRAAKARAEAEERRLTYVAATRARDFLWLSGKGHALEASGVRGDPRQENPLSRLQVRIARADEVLSARCRERQREELLADEEAERAAERQIGEPSQETRWSQALARVLAPPPAPRRVAPTLSVTELADFHRCPHRYYLWYLVGLRDGDTGEDAREWDAGEHGAQAVIDRGTAAHVVMEHLDFEAFQQADQARRRAQIEALLGAREVWLSSGDRHEVIEALVGALTSRGWLDELAQAQAQGRLAREVPFLITLRGERAEVALRGRIDLLISDGATVSVVDHKLALPRQGGAMAHRFQLQAYALGVSRLLGEDAPPKWRAGVLHLRSRDARPMFIEGPARGLEGMAEALPELAWRLVEARRLDRWERLTPEGTPREAGRCADEGCVFVSRCFGGRGR